jgi:hypothetical protein
MILEISLLALVGLFLLAALSGAVTVLFLAAVIVGARRDEAAERAYARRKPEAFGR